MLGSVYSGCFVLGFFSIPQPLREVNLLVGQLCTVHLGALGHEFQERAHAPKHELYLRLVGRRELCGSYAKGVGFRGFYTEHHPKIEQLMTALTP